MYRYLLPIVIASCAAAQEQWTPLFNGRNLDGWEVCNGFATYKVEDGAILGASVEKSPNTFLCTTREYGDFVLEFETRTDPALNSGVQIRSHRYPEDRTVMTFDGQKMVERKHQKGRVHGYQVEISNQESGASGGIYDEARRGWVANTSSDPACSKAFKDNQWNRYRVAAQGDRIRTWVNGTPCADLVDSMDLTGFIALQVHQFKGPHPAFVRWRNIRIQDLGRHEWRPLWDGRTFNRWTKTGGANFTVEEGAIHAAANSSDPRAGFLISDESFQDVTARVKFKIAKGNSGFFVRADKKTLAGYEVEIDAAKRTGGFWEVGGRNWVTGPEDNAGVLANDWNELTASLHGRRIVFHLNGARTVDLPDDATGRLEGHIALQCHGKIDTELWFKDIEVLRKVQ